MNDATTIANKLKSGQPLDGIGIIGRLGYAPPETNRVTRDASIAIFQHGLDASRIEVFYDYALTPAIRLIPSYQHIWEPFFAQVQAQQHAADVFLARTTVAW